VKIRDKKIPENIGEVIDSECVLIPWLRKTINYPNGIADLAIETGLSEESISQFLSLKELPGLEILCKILRASGFKLKISKFENETNDTQLSKEDIEKYGYILGRELHLTYLDVACLEHLLDFIEENNEEILKKHIHIIDYFMRIFFDRLYIKIFRLLDQGADVVSFYFLFQRSGQKHLWTEISTNKSFKKVKKWRNKMLAHFDKGYALNDELALQSYNDNKLDLHEINSFLSVVKHSLESLFDATGRSTWLFGLGDTAESREFREMLWSFSNIGKFNVLKSKISSIAIKQI
jgi:DNA-binding phage protein